MAIEYNDIYKTAKLSLFCKVIVFRTNDYDLSTVAFKCIIKTEPFFLTVLNEAVPSAKRTHRSSRTSTLSPLFYSFFSRTITICTSHISITVALTRTEMRFVRENGMLYCYNPPRVPLQLCGFRRDTQ